MPKFRVASATALLTAALAPVPAAANDAAAKVTDRDPMAALYACAGVTAAPERLACYDREAAALKARQDAGTFAAVDAAGAAVRARAAFGLATPPDPLPAAEAPPRAQVMTIADVRTIGADGALRVTMTNGQVWRQIDTDTNRRIAAGAEVVIERAALGSYLLTPKAGGIGVRVRREH